MPPRANIGPKILPDPTRGPKPALLISTCPNIIADYPAEALRRNETGTAFIEFEVNEHGDVQRATITRSSGSDVLDRATLERFKGCRFQPAYSNENPVAGKTTLEYVWRHR
jgi:TonB family protein